MVSTRVSRSRSGLRAVAAAIVFFAAARWADAQAFSLVHEFSGREGSPTELIRGSDGNLYGAATSGGDWGRGAVFVLTPDGSGGYTYSELHQFVSADGARGPDTPLLQAADGRLYGATFSSPTDGGAIFRVDTSGTFAVLHLLSVPDEGQGPGRLVQPDGGDLYGVTGHGGPQGRGTAFKMDASGVVTVVHVFDDVTGSPGRDLLAASDGFLYGVAYTGNGVIFRMDLAGSVTLVHAFSGSDGAFPNFLTEGSDGTLYGTTASGGAFGNGTIFTWDAAGSVTTLYSFPAIQGSQPTSVVEASDGNLYGTVFKADGGGTLFRFGLPGGFATLHEISPEDDGSGLIGALLEVGGRLLGAAYYSGPGGSGTVFSAGFAGEFDLVHVFAQDSNGYSPSGSLIQASDGMLYGVTAGGGDNGSGTAYRLDLAGGLTRVHSFNGSTDGRDPQPSLIQATNGDLYGAAFGGGPAKRGTVFRLSTSGVFTTLYAFSQTDVGSPLSEVVEGPGGDIFGTTTDFNADSGIAYRIDGAMVFQAIQEFSAPEGGSATALVNAPGGTFYGGIYGSYLAPGSLFQMDASGSLTTLHAFGGPEGYGVYAAPLLASDGNLYGVTDRGVFRMDLAGDIVVIHDFIASGDRSFAPSFGLMEASDGNFYSTVYLDKVSSGAVVRIDPSGNLSVVHLFQGSDGGGPRGTLLDAGDGYLYGTADGGALGGGVVYRLDPAGVLSLSNVSPASGPASGGTSLTLTGHHFQPGATVTIGSITAAGAVVSGDTEMTALAPALAAGMSYDVTVQNPDGTRSSRTRAWLADPVDVAPGDLFHSDVERIFRNGVTVGCGDGLYCVNLPVSRAQMAVLLLKSLLGAGYVPPPATGLVFADVPADGFAAAFIEDLAARGVSVGCGGNNYCQDAPVTRAEMAPFLLKGALGPGYVPPPATGTVFDDVAADAFAADWIEDLAARGIAAGCSAQGPLYCPDAATTRGQMAALLVDAFGLQ